VTTAKYIKAIEQQIREHQQVQMINGPTSDAWQGASAEISRLAALIVEAAKSAEVIRSGESICKVRYADGSEGAIRSSRLKIN
jgi:hypothetical protein